VNLVVDLRFDACVLESYLGLNCDLHTGITERLYMIESLEPWRNSIPSGLGWRDVDHPNPRGGHKALSR
jgi:hypothetical protein